MQNVSKSPQDGHQNISKATHSFGQFQLDVSRRRLLRAGEVLVVSPKVLDTLIVLVESAGRVVEKAELIQRLWPDSFVEEANLTQNIYTLRKLLGDAPDSPEYIATVPRRGYQFVAEVKTIEAGSEMAHDGTPALSFGSMGAVFGQLRGRRLVAAIVAAVVVVVGAVLVERNRATHTFASPPSPTNQRAAFAYNQGRYFLGKTRIEEKRKSIRYFEEAIAADPEYAPAYAALAKVYVWMYLRDRAAGGETAEKARIAAATALKLNPSLSDAHDAEAHVFLQIDHNWTAAKRELKNALDRNPNNVDAYDLLARGLRQREQFDQSIAAARRQVQLDPLSPVAHDNLAISLYQGQREIGETIDQVRTALELDPTSGLMERTLAVLYEVAGKYDEAIDARRRFERLQGRDELASAITRDYVTVGFTEAMRRYSVAKLNLLERAAAIGAYDPVEFTEAAVRIGEPGRAVEYLTRTIAAGHNPAVFAIAHDRLCALLKLDERFTRLLNANLVADGANDSR